MARARRLTILPLLVVLLSHSIWNTLQCVTSFSSEGSRHPISVVSIPREEFNEGPVATLEADQNQFVKVRVESFDDYDAEYGSQNHDPNYFTRPTRTNLVTGVGTRRLCGPRLHEFLASLCDNRYWSPETIPDTTRQTTRKRSLFETFENSNEFLVRRLPRTVVDECCKNVCSEEKLKKYCLPRDPNDVENETIPIKQPNNIVVQSPQNQNVQLQPMDESPVRNILVYLLRYISHRQMKPAEDLRERELPLPQPRVQDDYIRGPTPVVSTIPPSAASVHFYHPAIHTFREIDNNGLPYEVGFAQPALGRAETVASGSHRQHANHNFASPKPNELDFPIQTLQDTQTKTDDMEYLENDGSNIQNPGKVITLPLPVHMFSFGVRNTQND